MSIINPEIETSTKIKIIVDFVKRRLKSNKLKLRGLEGPLSAFLVFLTNRNPDLIDNDPIGCGINYLIERVMNHNRYKPRVRRLNNGKYILNTKFCTLF